MKKTIPAVFQNLGQVLSAHPSLGALRAQRAMAAAAGWSFAAAVVARAANLAALAISARVMGQVEFGQVGVIQSTVGMFAPLASLGLALTTTKFVAEYRDAQPQRAGRIIALSLCAGAIAGLVMTVALILLAPQLAEYGFGNPGLRKQLIESAGLLWLGVIEAVQAGALTGLEAYSRMAKLSVWGGLLSLPVTVALAVQYGASGAIAGLTLAVGISCVLQGVVLAGECRRLGIRTSLAGCASEKQVLLSFSLPAYVSGIAVAPVAWLGSALLTRQSDGLAEMALFTAADRFRYLLIFVPLAASRIAVPALSRHRAAGNDGAFRSTFAWNLGFGVLATLPPALVCAYFSPLLLGLFGSSFEAGWPVLAILSISAIPTVLNTQLGAALLSEGRAWLRTGVDVLLAVAFLAGAWFAVPRWNAAGLAGAFFAAYSLASLVLWISLRRTREVRP